MHVDPVRPLGVTSLRGLEVPVEVSSLAGCASSDWWRALRSRRTVDRKRPKCCARLFEDLAGECPDDPVPRLLAARICRAAPAANRSGSRRGRVSAGKDRGNG